MSECRFCGNTYNKIGNNKYCSIQCRDAFLAKECITCGKIYSKKNSDKYCSLACQQDHQLNVSISRWLEGEEIGLRPIKRWLEKQNRSCSCCGLKEWRGEPIPLDLEHIDGNSDNNRPANLTLLCPNCHAQTATYKGRNKGNGRAYRRQRYAEGKSY